MSRDLSFFGGLRFLFSSAPARMSRAMAADCPLLPAAPETAASGEAYFAFGWFWGPEASFGKLPGITATVVGYTGGDSANPTYRRMLDHTEALKVTYDKGAVGYGALLEKFFSEHRPDRPSKNCSPQYINAVWYKTEEQKALVDKKVAKLRAQGIEVNTRIAPMGDFYRAEEYHQKYFAKNGSRW